MNLTIIILTLDIKHLGGKLINYIEVNDHIPSMRFPWKLVSVT